MERIDYREATFNVIRTISCERTRQFDAANNYLYTHWDIVAEVNYQPVLAAYTAAGLPRGPIVPGFIPVAAPGASPGLTDLALLSRLLQPRGLLRITAGSTVILETPSLIAPGGSRYDCDVTGGPSIDVVGVPLMVGIKHWVVTLHIVADVRDIESGFPQGRSAVLSNLWVSSEDIDYQRRSVRRFAGRAILRADVLRLATINANNLRDLYLFKCPDHYRRTVIHVDLSEDGTTLDWAFEDTMAGYDVGVGSPIMSIECYRTGSVSRKSPLKFFIDLSRHFVKIASVAGGAAGALAGAAAAVVGAPIMAALDNLPESYRHCRCDLIGDRNADLGFLTATAMGICMQQIGFANLGQMFTGTLEMVIRQDVADAVYTSVEISTMFTDEQVIESAKELIREKPTPDSLTQWANFVPEAAARLNLASQQMTVVFLRDSRKLEIVEEPAQPAAIVNVPVNAPANNLRTTIVASRQGDQLGMQPGGPFVGQNDNPPMNRGAFGVVPQDMVGVIPPQPNLAGALPGGNIPAGIEHLIVQALMGPAEIPEEPDLLTTDS